MAALPQHRASVLAWLLGPLGQRVAALALLAVAAMTIEPGPVASAAVVDAVLADVNGAVLTASDVALARALGLFGFGASGAPVRRPDVERLVDVRLVEREAARLEIGGSPDAIEAAWQAAGAGIGGLPRLLRWLERVGIDPDWARQMVETDVRWRRFIEVRFRAFVFVAESDIAAALGTAAAGTEEMVCSWLRV